MAARPTGFLALVACLLLAGCPSSPPLAPDEIPGDFHFSYEMRVTDEEVFQRALDAEKAKNAPAEPEAAPEADPEVAPEADPEADPEAAPEPEAEEVPDETEGLPVTYAYVALDDPGVVKYEVHFGLGNPVKRTGTVELSDAAYQKIYRIIRDADVFPLKKRYVGEKATGTHITYIVKGNLHWKVIDVKGAEVPVLEKMWESVREILLDKDSRIFDNPKERADVFVIDRRTREFHRGNCPRLEEVSAEFRIRMKTWQQCVNAKASPCDVCRPLEER